MRRLFASLILFCALACTQVVTAQSADEYFSTAMTAYDAGNYEEALPSFNQAIKLNKNEAKFYKFRGDCRQRLGYPKAALSDYNKAEKAGFEGVSLHMSRGAAMIEMADLRSAGLEFLKVTEKEPDNADAWFNLASTRFLQYKHQEANEYYNKAISINPSFAEAYYFRGVARSEDGQQEEAITDIKKALELDSKLTDAYLSIAIIQFDQEMYEDAVKSLDVAIEKDAVHLAEAYFYRAEAKYKLEDSEGACEDWKHAGDLGDEEGKSFYMDYCLRNKEKKDSSRRGNREVITF